MTSRIANAFANARAENRGILGVFVTAGDPDAQTSAGILDALVDSHVDIVELGMPFSDPMADGPAIQDYRPDRSRREGWIDDIENC